MPIMNMPPTDEQKRKERKDMYGIGGRQVGNRELVISM